LPLDFAPCLDVAVELSCLLVTQGFFSRTTESSSEPPPGFYSPRGCSFSHYYPVASCTFLSFSAGVADYVAHAYLCPCPRQISLMPCIWLPMSLVPELICYSSRTGVGAHRFRVRHWLLWPLDLPLAANTMAADLLGAPFFATDCSCSVLVCSFHLVHF